MRVSYFIAELYGRPDEYDDPWDSPLAGLVKFADNTTFAHPVVCKVRGREGGRERRSRKRDHRHNCRLLSHMPSAPKLTKTGAGDQVAIVWDEALLA